MELLFNPMPVTQLTAEDRAIFNRFAPGTEFCCRLDDRADSINMTAAVSRFGSVVDAVLWNTDKHAVLVRPGDRVEGLKRLRVHLVQMLRTSEKVQLARAEGLQ